MRYRKKKIIIIEMMNTNIKFIVLVKHLTYELLYCEENRNIAMRYRKKKTIIIEIMNKNIKFVVFVNFNLHAVIL